MLAAVAVAAVAAGRARRQSGAPGPAHPPRERGRVGEWGQSSGSGHRRSRRQHRAHMARARHGAFRASARRASRGVWPHHSVARPLPRDRADLKVRQRGPAVERATAVDPPPIVRAHERAEETTDALLRQRPARLELARREDVARAAVAVRDDLRMPDQTLAPREDQLGRLGRQRLDRLARAPAHDERVRLGAA